MRRIKTLDQCIGMGFDVSAPDGHHMFKGRLDKNADGTWTIYQSSQPEVMLAVKSVDVELRGFDLGAKQAVHMSGTLCNCQPYVWRLENPVITKYADDRKAFRLPVDSPCIVELEVESISCRLVNISTSGVAIAVPRTLPIGSTFLLHTDQIKKCQVVRHAPMGTERVLHGCRYID